jgi:hypothetical protein
MKAKKLLEYKKRKKLNDMMKEMEYYQTIRDTNEWLNQLNDQNRFQEEREQERIANHF